MSYRTELLALEALAARLPFHVDESDRVNDAFVRYIDDPARPNRVVIDLWTYCYVRRYFLVKFLREHAFQASELDQVVEKTYHKVESARSSIDNPLRYAQWVSVVCRNTFVNFASRRKHVSALGPAHDRPIEEESHDLDGDLDVNAAAIHLALVDAIEQLPAFLQPVARMRFVENLAYEEISRIVGKRIPTIRSYVHKICARFRKDATLKAWADRLLQ